ncbi:Amidase domain-containing protein [Pseudohyphozyma bogoriensis]|nr:Amidase domain-containing protein [Pseudohyphozyma bogoriensis]
MGSIAPELSWQETAAKKKAAQAALIPPSLVIKSLPGPDVLDVTTFDFSTVLSSRDIEITEPGDVGALLAKLASGEYTAVEVTQAYSNRALVAHQLVNCLTEIFVDQALERAKELDAIFAKTGKPVGPLQQRMYVVYLGLPISLKDQIDVEGIELNMGYVGWVGNISQKNSVLVDILLAQGAIVYCRTNIPQALMFGEAVNAVWGSTLNPFNRNLTCGGSSGGEGALIGLKGSPLGVGSDLGGSIRIPAAFQGLYGLRPSYNRVPYQGSTNSMEGQEAVPSVLGPMTSSIDGLKIFMKAVADGKPWLADPIALRLPWNEDEYALKNHGGEGGQLCFAFMADDGVVKPQPPYLRAMEETKKALVAAGHKVIDWAPIDMAEGHKIIMDIYNADGGHDIDLACKLSGEPRMGWVLQKDAKHLSTYEYWQVCKAKLAHIKKQLDHWEATVAQTGTGRPVDAIICPASANSPQPHGKAQYIYYTAFCNLADYSASVFPVTKVDPAVDVKLPAHEFRAPADKMIYELYEPEMYRNAPISLQCVGRKNEEEAVIRMTEIIAEALAKAA